MLANSHAPQSAGETHGHRDVTAKLLSATCRPDTRAEGWCLLASLLTTSITANRATRMGDVLQGCDLGMCGLVCVLMNHESLPVCVYVNMYLCIMHAVCS
jgi:hypothetical protein